MTAPAAAAGTAAQLASADLRRQASADFVYITLQQSDYPPQLWPRLSASAVSRNPVRLWRQLSRLQRSLLTGLLLLAALWLLLMRQASAPLQPHMGATKSHITIARVDAFLTSGQLLATEQQLPAKSSAGVAARPSKVQRSRELPIFSGPGNAQQRAVVEAMRHAWKAYREHAWGRDHLRPISRTGQDWLGLGLTLVDSLDTLLIMGLREEFEEARAWVQEQLRFDSKTCVSVFETTIRVLGGLLSAFHLSGDEVFVERARQLAELLLLAWEQSPSGVVPLSDVCLKERKARTPAWNPDSSLSEVASVQLEFRELSRLLGDPRFERLTFNTSLHLHELGCAEADGLCPMYLDPKDGKFRRGGTLTMGARTDSYYEYLLKQWLQTGGAVDWLRTDYAAAIEAMRRRLWRSSASGNLSFVGEQLGSSGQFYPKMDHLVCFLAGTLALGHAQAQMPLFHLEIAQQLAETCARIWIETPTGLAPEIVHFHLKPQQPGAPEWYIKPLDSHCLLRPETVESLFYLHRVTGQRGYREQGWRIFEAIERYARVPGGGYASVANVRRIPVQKKDMQESFFLAETLKYLYLLFDDSQPPLFPLDRWTFNTEAHPLPLRSY